MSEKPRVINPTDKNPCTVRKMTQEERARYGPPNPVPEQIRKMRQKFKERGEHGYWSDAVDGFGLGKFDREEAARTKEEKQMGANAKGKKVDRDKMHTLFLQHGPGHAAAKKIAGELGCHWQTVLKTIREEGWKPLDVEITPTVISNVTIGNGFIPPLKVDDLERESIPVRTPIKEVQDTFMCNFVPDSGFFRTVEEIEADMESEKIKIDGKKSAAASAQAPDIDAAYFSALDDLAKAYSNESGVKKEIRMALLVDGLQGLQVKLHEMLDFLQSALSNEKVKHVEIAFGLQTLANSSVQGLMFLSSME